MKAYFCYDYDFEYVILSVLNLHLRSFIWCFKWMFFSLIKGINRKISKGISNIYSKVNWKKKLAFSKLWFS